MAEHFGSRALLRYPGFLPLWVADGLSIWHLAPYALSLHAWFIGNSIAATMYVFHATSIGFDSATIGHIDSAHPEAIGVDLLFDQPTEPDKDARLAEVIEVSHPQDRTAAAHPS